MASPSKLALAASLIVTAGIFYGGAKFASTIPVEGEPADSTEMNREMPRLAPLPDLEELDQSRSGEDGSEDATTTVTPPENKIP